MSTKDSAAPDNSPDPRPYRSDAYDRYRQAYGVVEISVIGNAKDTLSFHRAVLAHAIRSHCDGPESTATIDPGLLAAIEPIEIDERTYHGDWYDLDARELVFNGVIHQHDKPIEKPYFRDIPVNVTSSGSSWPELWSLGGQAFAFAAPPYSVQLSYPEKQAVYASIMRDVAPRGLVRVLNWHQPALTELVDCLGAGEEWWGVYVFTVFNKVTDQVFALVASETD